MYYINIILEDYELKKYNVGVTGEKKKELIEFIDTEIARLRQSAAQADEASKFIVTGPSQSGDKYHSENSAALAQEYLFRVIKLKKEIESADENPNIVALPVSSVEIEYEDANRLSFYLVKNAVSLTRFLFISLESPLGHAVFGKKVGERISYTPDSTKGTRFYSAKVIKIE